jgi:hypothetical protein
MSSRENPKRHPEDAIFEVKNFINQLSKVQDEKFETLCHDLSITDKGREWLFDYVYNCEEELCFDEYLLDHGIGHAECFSGRGGS